MKRQEIVEEITAKFRTFGGGSCNPNNPLSFALRDQLPTFAAGVDVNEVVDHVVEAIAERVPDSVTRRKFRRWFR